MKRLFAILLTVMLMMSLQMMTAFAGEPTSGKCGEDLTWSFDALTKTLTISGTGEMDDYVLEPGAPWSGFNFCTVIIGDGVTNVSGWAFYGCTELTKITIPDSVTSIGQCAFSCCAGVTEVTIPDAVTTIGESAFDGCSGLTEVTLPNSVTSIGTTAFCSCVGLKEITIPAGVTSIGYAAFAGCDGLTAVTISEGVTSIGGRAFSHCTGLTEVIVPGSVTTVERYAFVNCSALKKVTFSHGVKNIGSCAFQECTELTEITIPWSVSYIGSGAFQSCGSLKDVYYAGSTEQWSWISMEEGNEVLKSAVIHTYEGCDHTKTQIIPEITPTCDEFGLSEGLQCAECGMVLKNTTGLRPLGHGYDIQTGICVRCGAENPDYVPNPFTDIKNDDWFARSVMWAYENNVTGGTSPTTFGPDDGCTRAQVVTFLWAANGKPEPKSMDNPFSDVTDDAWYLKPVLWAVERGITGGVAEGKFGPERTCTRAQIVTFLYAAVYKPEIKIESVFGDVSESDWFAKPVLWAAKYGITGGIGDGKFGPNNTCTRAQVVTFLYKVYG